MVYRKKSVLGCFQVTSLLKDYHDKVKVTNVKYLIQLCASILWLYWLCTAEVHSRYSQNPEENIAASFIINCVIASYYKIKFNFLAPVTNVKISKIS